jgi:predicted RNA-binding Zn-ribbon protein involved in translation (DUF1610 family)
MDEELTKNQESEAIVWGYEGADWRESEQQGLAVFSCNSCGGEIVGDETLGATSCPFCGNPVVMTSRFAGTLRPDMVIPFRLGKDAALNALQKHYLGKKLLPKAFKDKNHLDEVKGVYVPFWLYDAETDAYMRFRATKTRSYTRGDYRVTETEHYRVVREGNMAFQKVPVDGSSKMPDTHMDAIEPYHYADVKPFSPAYMSGFFADKYDQDAEFCSKRANERITASTEIAFTNTVKGYSSLTREYANIKLKRGEVKYAMLPVWLLSTKWKGENFLFAMNGQTGKIIGDLPVDWGKFFSWLAGISIPLMILLGVIFLGAVT